MLETGKVNMLNLIDIQFLFLCIYTNSIEQCLVDKMAKG